MRRRRRRHNFVHLARVGAFDHAHISHVEPFIRAEVQTPALSDVQKAAAVAYVPEHKQKIVAGMLTVCSENALSFNIALGPNGESDEHCTPFASVGSGAEVIRIIGKAPTDHDGKPLANMPSAMRDAQLAPPKEPPPGN